MHDDHTSSTRADAHRYVTRALGEDVEDFDVEGITDPGRDLLGLCCEGPRIMGCRFLGRGRQAPAAVVRRGSTGLP